MKRLQACSFCVAAALLFGFSVPASGCGDKLSVISGGVTFDKFAAEHRGNVVMLVEPYSSLRAANEDLKLRQALQRAGHRVRTVESPAELATVLDRARVDVVLVSLRENDDLQRQFEGRATAPSMLRVAYKSDPALVAAASKDADCFVLAVKDQDGDLVHRVGKLVAQRATKSAQQCDVARAQTTST